MWNQCLKPAWKVMSFCEHVLVNMFMTVFISCGQGALQRRFLRTCFEEVGPPQKSEIVLGTSIMYV